MSAEVLQQLPAEDVSWATLDANLLLLILTPLRASTSLDDRRACGRFRSVCSGWRDVHDQSSTLLRLRTAGGRAFNFRRGRWPNVTTVESLGVTPRSERWCTLTWLEATAMDAFRPSVSCSCQQRDSRRRP